MIIHKRQVFRCAPEQVTAATSEEKILAETPQAELPGSNTSLVRIAAEPSVRTKLFKFFLPSNPAPEARAEANVEPGPMTVQEQADAAASRVEDVSETSAVPQTETVMRKNPSPPDEAHSHQPSTILPAVSDEAPRSEYAPMRRRIGN